MTKQRTLKRRKRKRKKKTITRRRTAKRYKLQNTANEERFRNHIIHLCYYTKCPENRSRLEILELSNIQNMLMTEELFQEDRSRLKMMEL